MESRNFNIFQKLGYICPLQSTRAGVVKLVDTLDLGSSASRRGGSSPFTRTQNLNYRWGFFIMSIDAGATCISPPTAFTTFIRVENCSFDTSESVFYKQPLSPVSSAIFVLPMALAVCPSIATTSEVSPSFKTVFRYSVIISVLSKWCAI